MRLRLRLWFAVGHAGMVAAAVVSIAELAGMSTREAPGHR